LSDSAFGVGLVLLRSIAPIAFRIYQVNAFDEPAINSRAHARGWWAQAPFVITVGGLDLAKIDLVFYKGDAARILRCHEQRTAGLRQEAVDRNRRY
jgi:hypothetical protein